MCSVLVPYVDKINDRLVQPSPPITSSTGLTLINYPQPPPDAGGCDIVTSLFQSGELAKIFEESAGGAAKQ